MLAGLPHRIDYEAQIGLVAVNGHVKRLMLTAWRLGDDPALAELNLRHWSHQLGFRGHWLTKSRRYSTTFTALRQERATWRAQHQHGGQLLDSWGRPHNEEAVERLAEWRFVGAGYRNHADAWLATTASRSAREARELAKEEFTAMAA